MLPDTAQAKIPVVVVCHDWSGINDGMKANARAMATLGFACFALDVYGKGIRGDELGDNQHLMQPLMEDRNLLKNRLLSGIEALQSIQPIDPQQIVVVGWCFGGLCALDLARANAPGLKGAISVHGGLGAPFQNPLDLTPIAGEILILHGWNDPVAPPQDVIDFAKEMDARKTDWEMHIYGNTMHAFTFDRANMPEKGILYHERSAQKANLAMKNFLKRLHGIDV